jgi:hypothetical protein
MHTLPTLRRLSQDWSPHTSVACDAALRPAPRSEFEALRRRTEKFRTDREREKAQAWLARRASPRRMSSASIPMHSTAGLALCGPQIAAPTGAFLERLEAAERRDEDARAPLRTGSTQPMYQVDATRRRLAEVARTFTGDLGALPVVAGLEAARRRGRRASELEVACRRSLGEEEVGDCELRCEFDTPAESFTYSCAVGSHRVSWHSSVSPRLARRSPRTPSMSPPLLRSVAPSRHVELTGKPWRGSKAERIGRGGRHH